MRHLPLTLALLFAAVASAQAPRTIGYQGVLDDGGAPVTTPTDLSFRLYDAASGGRSGGARRRA